MAPYQIFKLNLVRELGLSKDGFHIILGFAVFLLFALLAKRKLGTWKLLIAPLIFACTLEVLDARDAFAYGQPIDVIGSLHDIAFTTLLPVLTILFMKLKKVQVERKV